MPKGCSQADHNKRVFASFLAACPILASRNQVDRYPDEREQFPDVVTMLNSSEVWWELGEWLNPNQMQAGQELERLRSKLQATLGGLDNRTRHVLRCTLRLRRTNEKLTENVAEKCRQELSDLLLDADSFLETQDQLVGPYSYPKVADYEGLVRFVDKIWIWKKGGQQETVATVPWIRFQDPGGSYNPEEAIIALKNVVQKKLNKYADALEQDVRLIIHYGQASVYNTPFESPTHLTFEEVAQMLATGLYDLTITSFSKIYLLNEMEPEAFKVYPSFCLCE